MATRSDFVPWRDVEPERSDTWITAAEFEEQVAQAKAMQVEARADREFYDNDAFFLPGTGGTYFHGERG